MNINTSFSPALARTRLASMAQPQTEASENSNVPSDSVTLSAGEPAEKPSRLSYIAKGALYGGLGGLILPGVVVPLVGFAAAPITAPIGLVLGAIAGASAYDHPDYKPN